MITNTANHPSRTIVDLLRQCGVRRAVACPGSRNAPLLVALSRCEEIEALTVVDERCAAFVALGISVASRGPVALLCTSGTALLNFAPAVAEAFYRKVPLIVISADRPLEWIDQDDSQTIRQHGALANFVKQSYDIPAWDSPERQWYVNRVVNDAMAVAMRVPQGPVHINLRIAEPIGKLIEHSTMPERRIDIVEPQADLSTLEARQLGLRLASPRKVMIVAGFGNPSPNLNRALARLAALDNVVVLTETLANLHNADFISDIDATLSSMSIGRKRDMLPDVVITTGGSLVSRMLKQYLRDAPDIEHWHVGPTHTTVDCFRHLSLKVEMQPSLFFSRIASSLQPHDQPSDYRRSWLRLRDAARSMHQAFTARAPWTDLKAFATFIPLVPRNYNLQLSNGTPVRYAQLFTERRFHRCDCNRGVSGIDGSTSTALGAATVYKSAPTLLITGDMSAQYDMGALATLPLSPRFKMIVIANGGGGIFHFIEATRRLDIVGRYFDTPCAFPARELARAFRMDFFEASSEEDLRRTFPAFIAADRNAAMMVIRTDAEQSATTLREYFSLKLPESKSHNHH